VHTPGLMNSLTRTFIKAFHDQYSKIDTNELRMWLYVDNILLMAKKMPLKLCDSMSYAAVIYSDEGYYRAYFPRSARY